MPKLIVALTVAALAVVVADPALAAQGPGTSQGTAGPVAQWMAALCGIGFATLGVVFSAFDDGTYGDF
ncbi:MAG: hypothetical protein JO254_10385 [Pseudolabrys sp.]|nr:hypothetical protein [Pseudolabrys sp.]